LFFNQEIHVKTTAYSKQKMSLAVLYTARWG